MTRYILVSILLVGFCLSVTGFGSDGLVGRKVPLFKVTHINYDVESWDTVLVDVMDSTGGTKVTTIGLQTINGDGRWYGSWTPSVVGNYVINYIAVYSGTDSVIEEDYLEVRDTLDQHMLSYIGTPTDPASMATSLFGGQQYIADNMGGGGASGCGAGAFVCTVNVKQTSDSATIPYVHVLVKNQDESGTIAHGWTDANGQIQFLLDSMATDLTYKFWLIQREYTFSFPESADVNLDTSLTFYGTEFDYGDPPPDSLVAIVGQIFNPFADSLSGVRVYARLHVPGDSIVTYLGFPISPFTVADTTGVDGRFRMDLIPNDKLKPDSTKYIWNFEYPTRWGGYFTPEDQDTTYIGWQADELQWGVLRGRQ